MSNKSIERSLSFYFCSIKTLIPRTKFEVILCEYCCGPGTGGESDHYVGEVTSSPTRLPELSAVAHG